jgi:GGDEF domain-containing protein
MGDDDRDTGTDLVQHLRLRWGVRCIFARTPFLATTGPDALALCGAVTAALESPTWSPAVALAVRRWRTGVSSLADAASALRCLSETVAEVVTAEYGERQPPGLDTVLEQLIGEATSASARRAGTDGVDLVTRCRNRLAFERDLEDAVVDALVSSGDAALALVELDPSAKRSDADLLSLAVALRRTVGGAGDVYRVGARKFAVLLAGEDVTGAGAIMLRATCHAGPRFGWGVASVHSAGIVSPERAEVVVLLAEADLHLRRRDYTHARHMLARHRRNSALAAVAGAMVLVAGVVLGIGSAVHPPPHGQVALPPPTVGPPAPQTVTPPAAVPSPNPVLAPTPAMSVPAHGNLVSYVTPSPTGQPPPPTSPPPPPTPLPALPPGSGPVPPPPPTPPPLGQLLGSTEQLLNGLISSVTSV